MTDEPWEKMDPEQVARAKQLAEEMTPDPDVKAWAIRVSGIINTLEVNPEIITEEPEVALALIKGAFNSQPTELMLLTTVMMMGLQKKIEKNNTTFEEIVEANNLGDLFKE